MSCAWKELFKLGCKIARTRILGYMRKLDEKRFTLL